MIVAPTGVKVYIACGATDMRKGIDGLATLVQEVLLHDPFAGHLFVFRGGKANLITSVGRNPVSETASASRSLSTNPLSSFRTRTISFGLS